MTKPDDEIISDRTTSTGMTKIGVPLAGERLHHPLPMTLSCVSTWKRERAFLHLNKPRMRINEWDDRDR